MTDESEKADIVDRLRMAARVGDVPFYYDDAGKMVFHDDTMSEAAALITSLRKQLEEARADKLMVDGLLLEIRSAQEALLMRLLPRFAAANRSLAQEGDKP